MVQITILKAGKVSKTTEMKTVSNTAYLISNSAVSDSNAGVLTQSLWNLAASMSLLSSQKSQKSLNLGIIQNYVTLSCGSFPYMNSLTNKIQLSGSPAEVMGEGLYGGGWGQAHDRNGVSWPEFLRAQGLWSDSYELAWNRPSACVWYSRSLDCLSGYQKWEQNLPMALELT